MMVDEPQTLIRMKPTRRTPAIRRYAPQYFCAMHLPIVLIALSIVILRTIYELVRAGWMQVVWIGRHGWHWLRGY